MHSWRTNKQKYQARRPLVWTWIGKLGLFFGITVILSACRPSESPGQDSPTLTRVTDLAAAPQSLSTTTEPPEDTATTTRQSEAAQLAWREDLAYLDQRMETLHPNLYFYRSQSEFESAIKELDMNIPYLTNDQMVMEFMRIAALPKDGHTFLFPFQDSAGFQLYPLRLYLFSDGLFVVDAQAPYQEAVGAKVLRIGNVDIEDAQQKLQPYISYDNEMSARLIMPIRLIMPEALEALGIIEDIEMPMYLLEDGSRVQFNLNPAPISIDAYRQWNFPEEKAANQIPDVFDELTFLSGLQQQPEPLSLSARYAENFWYTYLEASQTLYIQINFVLRQSPSGHSVTGMSRDISELLEENEARRVVVDLRHNPGGNNNAYPPMLRMLSETESINQRDKLFVLIGRQTFSAAANLVTEMEQLTEAIFVGEPTGGSPNLYADPATVRLPNSGLEVLVSTRYWQKSTPDDDRLTIEPDIAIDLSSAEFFAGQDPVLESIVP
jgi:hypothetical protein